VSDTEAPVDPNAPVTGMEYFMQLEYHEVICPTVRRYSEALMEGKLIGHKCPGKCGLVYSPPRGYCPIDTIETTDADEVQLADHGVVTGYTVVTPVQYYGQDKTEPFAKASVSLDGGGMLSLQDILELPADEVRVGLRVEAVWAPESERTIEEIGNRSWGGADGCIRGWKPTGEPDVPQDRLPTEAF
jgi:uncharacterized OB-fold protein